MPASFDACVELKLKDREKKPQGTRDIEEHLSPYPRSGFSDAESDRRQQFDLHDPGGPGGTSGAIAPGSR